MVEMKYGWTHLKHGLAVLAAIGSGWMITDAQSQHLILQQEITK